jgi:hypothetical protein
MDNETILLINEYIKKVNQLAHEAIQTSCEI